MTRVLIIDDSALMRQMLTHIINRAPGFEVVGTAPDPLVAWDKIKTLRPDVVTLDVEMPKMDGITFLEGLMQHNPVPVVMVSSLTQKGCETTLQALELGAIDFVTKPAIDLQRGIDDLAVELIAKLEIAARARVGGRRAHVKPAPRAAAPLPLAHATHHVIAIGASTGGTEALRVVLEMLPPDAPGVVIVQHMPERFTTGFAERLDRLCQVRVKEAETGDRVLPGHVLLARGNHHLRVVRSGATYHVEVFQPDPVNRFRPSVDVLFHACAPGRQALRGGDPDRHGGRRRAWPARAPPRGRDHVRPGRGDLGGVRHAARGVRDGRRDGGAVARGDRPGAAARGGVAPLLTGRGCSR